VEAAERRVICASGCWEIRAIGESDDVGTTCIRAAAAYGDAEPVVIPRRAEEGRVSNTRSGGIQLRNEAVEVATVAHPVRAACCVEGTGCRWEIRRVGSAGYVCAARGV